VSSKVAIIDFPSIVAGRETARAQCPRRSR
jgi:hypothetical protein